MTAGHLAIILLTKNAAATLEECLEAISAQGSSRSWEILALDSGSTDRTRQILRGHGVRVIEISPHAFQHGRSRNLGASLCSPGTEYLVYLTQDATPLAGWLDALVDAVALEPTMAGAFSRHVPRPDCNPLLARRIIEEWPQVGGMERLVKRWDGTQDATRNWHELAHFSNTSSCIRQAVWQAIPFPEVDFAEDVAWASLVLRAGYSLAYEPASAVLHSHSGSLFRQLRENVDHGWGVRQALGQGRAALMAPRYSAPERIRRDLRAIWKGPGTAFGRIRWTLWMPMWYAASLGGQWVGARLDRFPDGLRTRLSWQAARFRAR